MFKLGQLYLTGDGVVANKQKAMELIEGAANKGYSDALDWMNRQGHDTTKTNKVKKATARKEEKPTSPFATISNVRCSTNGRNKLCIEFDCLYAKDCSEWGTIIDIYQNNKKVSGYMGADYDAVIGEKYYCVYINDYGLNIQSHKTSTVTLRIEIRELNELYDGTQNSEQFNLIASHDIKLKLYREVHLFGKNVLENKKIIYCIKYEMSKMWLRSEAEL